VIWQSLPTIAKEPRGLAGFEPCWLVVGAMLAGWLVVGAMLAGWLCLLEMRGQILTHRGADIMHSRLVQGVPVQYSISNGPLPACTQQM